jgi:hypothetical protein
MIKKIWFSFEPFKHFCQHFISTCFLIIILIFWNHLCTRCSHAYILCNNLVDCTFIKYTGDYSNCQTSILMNESPHTVDVCACSHRSVASGSHFIFHRFLPLDKVFVPLKHLSMWYRIIAKYFLYLVTGIGSILHQLDTKLDYMPLLEMFLHHFCDAVTKHTTNQNRTSCIHASKFRLRMKVKERCSYHLVMILMLQRSKFLHYKINLITLLTHHAASAMLSFSFIPFHIHKRK